MRAIFAALALMGCAASDGLQASPHYRPNTDDPPEYIPVQQADGGSGTCMQLDHDGALAGAGFFDRERRILTWSFDGTARTWDASSGLALRIVRQDSSILEAVLTQDETRLVTSGHDRTARIWNIVTGEQLTPPLLHEHWVWGLALSPDDSMLVTSSHDDTAKIWNIATGAQVGATLPHPGVVWGARFSRNGARVLTWAVGAARVWDASTGRLQLDLSHGATNSVDGALFFAEETRIVTWGYDGAARVWDASSGAPLVAMQSEAPVDGAALSPDERHLLTWGSSQDPVKVWDIATGQLLTELGRGEQHSAGGAAFFSDQNRVLTWAYDDTARVWDISTGRALSPPMRSDDQVLGAALSPDERRILTWSRDWTARLFDVATGAQIGPPMLHYGSVDHAYFSSDGQRVLTTSADHTARVWSLSELTQFQLGGERERFDWRCQPTSTPRARRVRFSRSSEPR